MKLLHKIKFIGLVLTLAAGLSNSIFAAGIDTPLLKTQWGDRGGKLQFSPNRERAKCTQVAVAQVLYYYGFDIQGSKSYATTKNVYWRDFDANPTKLSTLPLTFDDNTATDAQMKDYDNYLYNCAILMNQNWENSTVYDDTYENRIAAHVPISAESYYYGRGKNTDISKQDFQAKIIENVNKKIPVIYGIESENGVYSHAVIIDAVKTVGNDVQVHLNFGWNGKCDGWYDLWKPILVKDHTAEGGYRNYNAEKKHIVIINPLDSTARKNWKPEKLTNEQIQNIKKETRKVCELIGDTLYIPEGTTYLYTNVKNNKKIKNLKFPSTLKVIPSSSSLEGCVNIKEVEFPKTIKKVAKNSFLNCTGLEKIVFNGEQVEDVLTDAFAGCTNLKTAIFTSSCKIIPDGIFWKLANVKDVTISEGVEYIDYGAFYNTSIADIKLPSTVREIGDYAFYKTALKEIYIPSSVKKIGVNAFSKTVKIICDDGSEAQKWALTNGYKTELKNGSSSGSGASVNSVYTITNGTLTFDKNITNVSEEMFKENTSIKEAVFGEKIIKVAKNSFLNCTGLEKITFNALNATGVFTDAFAGCTNLKTAIFTSSCKIIPDGIFWKLASVKDVTISEGVEYIDYGAFYNTSIADIKLPSTVREIGDYAFYKTALTEIYIPLTVKKIGTSAFSKTVKIICDKGSVAEAWAKSNGNSYQIKGSTPVEDYAISNGKLTIREGLSSIPKEKFMGNKEIREIVFPTTITKLGTDSFKDCTNLENIIYNGVRCSGASTNTFDGCTKLKSVTFTSSCRAISDGIFWKITSLKEVTLAEGIEDIRYGAFYNTSISNVKIPSTVKEIGDYAFYKTALTEIYIPSTVTKIGTSAFSKTVKIICDKGSAAEAWAKKNGNKCEIKN